MKKNILFLNILTLLLIGLVKTSVAQNLDELYRIVDKKINTDKSYLDLYAVVYSAKESDLADLKNIPLTDGKGVFNFKISDATNYSIVFLKENLDFDSLTILYIKEITDKSASGDNLFDESTGGSVDSNIVVRFKDLNELYFSNQAVYRALYNLVNKQMNQVEPISLLQINTEEKNELSAGISSSGNIDFLAFERVNNIHRYPKPKADAVSTPGSGPRSRAGATGGGTSDFQIDASLSHVTFFHKEVDYGFGTVSVELNTMNEYLNILPWQGFTLNGGVRALVNVSGNMNKIDEDFVIDAKILGRFRLDTKSLVENLPFIFGKTPLLNVGNGFVFDIKTTGVYDIPFFNLYFATGSEDIETPYAKIGNEAYFSFTQWATSMSFFWNTNERRSVRFKMEIGMGGYEVVKGDYSTPVTQRMHVKDVFSPVIGLSLNVVPNNIEFAGFDSKFFDSHLNLKFWMKLFEFSNEHLFRFELFYITAPFFREPEIWEQKSGQSMIQLRYRYGF